MKTINVTKATGELEPYDENKLRRSLANAGADQKTIDLIADHIKGILHEGVSTRKIYKEAFRMLRQRSNRFAGRYKLKEAILELGPTGYPFEKFIAELLTRLGYKTSNGEIVEGDCVSHEIDVIAQKGNSHYMIECKFHNRKDHSSNVKVPLYIQSRFKDVEKNWRNMPGHKHKSHQGWVVTNTRFTKDALQYGTCIDLKMLSWGYPKHEGLKDLISRVNLHPITCLSSLEKKEKQLLLEQDIVFCTQLCEDETVLTQTGLDSRKKNLVLKEATDICNF